MEQAGRRRRRGSRTASFMRLWKMRRDACARGALTDDDNDGEHEETWRPTLAAVGAGPCRGYCGAVSSRAPETLPE